MSNQPMKYRFKRKDRANCPTPLDDVEFCYDQRGHDYGLAGDDSRLLGLHYVTVTLNSDGDYPGFTIPKADIEEANETDSKLVDIQEIKNSATRQFRHNDDNSPSLNKPAGGFVIAYDKEIIDAAIQSLQQALSDSEADVEKLSAKLASEMIKNVELAAMVRELESMVSVIEEFLKKSESRIAKLEEIYAPGNKSINQK